MFATHKVQDALKFVFWERFNGKLYPPRMPITTAFKGPLIFILLFSLAFVTACNEAAVHHSEYNPDSVEVASIRFARNLYKYVQVTLVKKNTVKDDQLPLLKITDSAPRSWIGRFPPSVIEKEIILKFRLKNSSDSIKDMYFFPGSYFISMRLFKQRDSLARIEEVKTDSTPVAWKAGFRLFEIPPRDTATYFARLEVLRSSATVLNPVILQKDFIEPFVAARIQNKKVTNMFTYLVAGIMLMMVIYSLAAYRLNRSKEFLYYSGYVFFIGLLLFLKSFLIYNFSQFNFFFESYWD